MHPLFGATCAAFFALFTTSQAATVVGLRFVGGANGSLYDIVTIDTDTGNQKALVRSAFEDIWGGSFITDPETGIGYALTTVTTPPPNFGISTELYRYELATGKVLPAIPRSYGGAMALGANGLLISMRYIESGEGYDIITINPKTGATKTLIPKAVKEFWGGSFISDSAAGVGYIIDNARTLIRFDLETGRTLGKTRLTYGGPLALAPGGELVGIRGGDTSSDIVSIDPETGLVKTLAANAFSDFYGGTFSTDVAAGLGCVLTSERRIFVFDLETGAVQSAAHRMKSQISYARFAGAAKARSSRIIYSGKGRLTVRKPFVTVKGKATGKVTAVRYRVRGSSGFKTATGTTNWTLKARVKRGENKLLIHASGPDGSSLDTSITITRK
jgi:hypothetical protein